MSEGRIRGLWAPPTRGLTVGLVLSITFVAVSAGLNMVDVKVGAPVALSFDPRRLYLFDTDGQRVNL